MNINESRTSEFSINQLRIMLDFMTSHKADLAGKFRRGKGIQHRQKLWNQLTDILNSVGDGPQKSMEQWKMTWNEYKCNERREQARELVVARKQTGSIAAGKQLSERDKHILTPIVKDTIECLENIPEPGLPLIGASQESVVDIKASNSMQSVQEDIFNVQSTEISRPCQKRPHSPSPEPSNNDLTCCSEPSTRCGRTPLTSGNRKRTAVKSTMAAEPTIKAYAEATARHNTELVKNTQAIGELASSFRSLAASLQFVADSLLVFNKK